VIASALAAISVILSRSFLSRSVVGGPTHWSLA
jgi:hypothetical protein